MASPNHRKEAFRLIRRPRKICQIGHSNHLSTIHAVWPMPSRHGIDAWTKIPEFRTAPRGSLLNLQPVWSLACFPATSVRACRQRPGASKGSMACSQQHSGLRILPLQICHRGPMSTKRAETRLKSELQPMRHLWPGIETDLVRLGVNALEALQNREPEALFSTYCVLTGKEFDLCVQDRFTSVVEFSKTGEPRARWRFTRERSFPQGVKNSHHGAGKSVLSQDVPGAWITAGFKCIGGITASEHIKRSLIFRPRQGLGRRLGASSRLTRNIHYPSSGNLTNHHRCRQQKILSLQV